MRIIKFVCLIVGGFLVTAGVLVQAWLPGQVLKTPLDVDSKIHMTGTAESGLLFSGSQKVNIFNQTTAVAGLSDDSNVAWGTWKCVVIAAPGAPDCVQADDPTYKLVNASSDTYLASRTSGLAVSDTHSLPAGVKSATGLVNKFPFNSKKTTYPYWDSTLQKAVPAAYQRTEKLDGLTTYVYELSIPDTVAEISDGVQGTYRNTMQIYVEPLTGAVVNQVADTSTTLSDGTVALAVKAAFTDKQIATSVSEAKDNRRLLVLMLDVAPFVLYALGALLLAGGLVLAVRSARRQRPVDREASVPQMPLRGAHA
ncbi:DUF3068 domain-containing protein [Nocardioides sp. Kera G14]|uniref:DUF3068 domain-containing protein n=1 Tax=Nocardioides sp. Kera G14 TaxID=2884264 RepID=UPI001D12A626|nr:DUF3068 domain-containing protein [Nocardioides sp. Kera G14]UDY22251.1 DUF3068 domain-containing protein [Nocardioides sp. Kera G14]